MSQPRATLPIEGFGNGSKNLFPPESIEETKALVSYLCQVINFARDIQDCEQLSGGNNNAILFTCLPLAPNYNNKRIPCVLRTCKRNWFKSTPPTDTYMKSIIALSQKMRTYIHLPIPSTLVYDCTYENHIQSPYMIQERVRGETLEHEYFKLYRGLEFTNPRNPHLERRCRYARAVAGFVAQIDRVEMPGYGVFSAHVNMPEKGTRINAGVGISRDQVDGRKIPTELNFSQWVDNLLNAQVARTTDIFLTLSHEEMERVRVLRQIGTEMMGIGLLMAQPAVLWHSDFYPRNILIKNTRNNVVLTGVIDWDDAKALPRIVTRKPPSFLWNMTENPLLPEEKNKIKMVFDEEMRMLSPDRGYEGDAYEESRVLVRALCMYALFGPRFRHYVEMSFEELVGKWERFTGRFYEYEGSFN